MFCKKCGKNLSDDSLYCQYCGCKMESKEAVVSPAAIEFATEGNEIPTEPILSHQDVALSPEHHPEPNRKWNFVLNIILCFTLIGVAFLAISGTSFNERDKKIDKLYSSAEVCSEKELKLVMKNPDTAVFTHDSSMFRFRRSKAFHYGTVKFVNSDEVSVDMPFEFHGIFTENSYYCLYLKMGDIVYKDFSGCINSLGIASATAENYFENAQADTYIFTEENGALLNVATEEDAKITLSEYNAIDMGMTYYEVSDIIGGYGNELARSNIIGYETAVLTWEGNGITGSNASITFQSGEVFLKAQLGLE